MNSSNMSTCVHVRNTLDGGTIQETFDEGQKPFIAFIWPSK